MTLPKFIRDERGWSSGTRLIIEKTANGVLLRRDDGFAPTRPEDVYGCLEYDGPTKTIDEMKAGIIAAVKRHQ